MAKSKGQLKDRVASFRINRGTDTQIEERIKKKIVGCNTANKFYRKLALDWFNGKLVYTNPEDFNTDPDVAAVMQPAEVAQSPVSKG